MKEKIVFCAMVLFAFILASTGGSQAAERKVRLKVPEMTCATRGLAAVTAATAVAGVKSADDDLDNTILTVVFDDAKTNVAEISKALEKEKFPVDGEPVFSK